MTGADVRLSINIIALSCRKSPDFLAIGGEYYRAAARDGLIVFLRTPNGEVQTLGGVRVLRQEADGIIPLWILDADDSTTA